MGRFRPPRSINFMIACVITFYIEINFYFVWIFTFFRAGPSYKLLLWHFFENLQYWCLFLGTTLNTPEFWIKYFRSCWYFLWGPLSLKVFRTNLISDSRFLRFFTRLDVFSSLVNLFLKILHHLWGYRWRSYSWINFPFSWQPEIENPSSNVFFDQKSTQQFHFFPGNWLKCFD